MEVSVIIPVYNTEKYIGRCLDSVLNQTFQDFEIIVVDDKGQDNAIHIAEKYAENDERIKIIHHSENKGLMMARRSGYSAASGEYFMFLDSDDTLPSDSIEKLYKKVRSNDYDLVIGGYKKIRESEGNNDIGEDTEIIKLPRVSSDLNSKDCLSLFLKGRLTHNLAFCIFSSKLFHNEFITLENQTNGEDLILMFQIVAKCGRIGILRDIVYNYFYNPTSSSHISFDQNKLRQLINVHNFILKFSREQGCEENAIFSAILPSVLFWPRDKWAKQLIKNNLDGEIREKAKFFNSLKYLTRKTILRLILRKLHLY